MNRREGTQVDLTAQTEPLTLIGVLNSIRAFHREHEEHLPEALLLTPEQTQQFCDLIDRRELPKDGPALWQGVQIRTVGTLREALPA